MTKLFSELVPGDIIRTVYGDFDNWVTVEVISIKKEPPVTHPNGRTTQWMAVECKYARKIPYEHDKPFEMWSYVDSKVQIIDKEDLK